MMKLFLRLFIMLGTVGSAFADHHHVLDTSKESMKKIAKSLGVECSHCHTAKTEEWQPDFKAPSIQKTTAIHMKQHFVDSLRTSDGKALECATCHNGSARFIPREPEEPAERFTAKMERREVMQTMKGFTKALGVKCLFCHTKAADGRMDPTIPTKHRTMARFMLDTYGDLKTLDGEAATCMTCHHGKTEFLPRYGKVE
jgi:hypothetical protein